ncbi:MAG: M20/M25/M40 family metallo-hydrolase [Butyrivibrio sp.]|nr:M20/M25/M40 family metallo-hydrolase [Butyrivibrio sp.]
MPANKDRILNEFIKLVSFDSESYHERKIADYLIDELGRIGIEAQEDRAYEILSNEAVIEKNSYNAGNIFARTPATGSGKPLLFSAHMDTVKPGNGKRAIVQEDGRITSDGTTVLGADDIGGIVAILEMLRVYKEDSIPHPELEIIFPIAEEPYGQGSRVFDYTQIKARAAFVLDLSGSLGRAAIAAPTIISFTIQIRGKSAHAGFCPEDGIHAIAIASEAISRLKNGWVSEDTTLNIGTIQGGTQRNSVPDYVEITGEIRSLEHDKALDQEKHVKEIFDNVAKKYGGEAAFESTIQIKSYRTSKDSEAVKRFEAACLKIFSKEGELIETYGGSDHNHFAQHEIEGIVVASAMQDVHTTSEYTTIDDLYKVAELAIELGRSTV